MESPRGISKKTGQSGNKLTATVSNNFSDSEQYDERSCMQTSLFRSGLSAPAIPGTQCGR